MSLTNNNPIFGFSGEYDWLSNFAATKIEFAGITFPSVEHAYVASKSLPQNFQENADKILKMTAPQAKRHGRRIKLNQRFELDKYPLMAFFVHQKYVYNHEFSELLLNTGNVYIEETNTWGDKYWGVCDGVGHNHLGKLIMQTRAYLQEQLNDDNDR